MTCIMMPRPYGLGHWSAKSLTYFICDDMIKTVYKNVEYEE